MDKSLMFERAYVALVTERVEAAGLSHSEFGRRVFGEESGSRLWRSCRDTGRTRRLLLAEAHKMAEVLGTDYPTMVWEITREAHSRRMM